MWREQGAGTLTPGPPGPGSQGVGFGMGAAGAGQGFKAGGRALLPFPAAWVWGSSLSVDPLAAGECTSCEQAGSCLCRFHWDASGMSVHVWPPWQDRPPDLLSERPCDSQGQRLRE